MLCVPLVDISVLKDLTNHKSVVSLSLLGRLYSIISFTCQFGHVPIFVWKVRSISQDERIFQKKPALAHLYVLLAQDDVTYIHHVAWNTLSTVLLNHTELLKLVSLVPLGSSLIILLFPVAQL